MLRAPVSSDQTDVPWLLLLFQLPTRPTAARVRTWRQLQRLGAIPVKNSGYALPQSAEAREDFEWLRADIVAAGGDAAVFAARAVDEGADGALRAAFRSARAAEFEALRQAAVKLARGRPRDARRPGREVRALADRLAHLESIDFFSAPSAPAARAAIGALLHPSQEATVTTAHDSPLRAEEYRRRTWVTRPRPGIDRFASAWLIRRFIDPNARFEFADSLDAAVAGRGRRRLPFDMFGAEFGHAAGGCTFETLVRRFDIRAPGIGWLARVVHALDLKVDDGAPPDAAPLGRLVDGLRQLHADDRVLLERGIEVIEAYYRSRPPAADASSPRARSAAKRGKRGQR
jgi:hypothetical protein